MRIFGTTAPSTDPSTPVNANTTQGSAGAANGFAGSLVAILIWLIATGLHVDVPNNVAIAMTIVVAAVTHYFGVMAFASSSTTPVVAAIAPAPRPVVQEVVLPAPTPSKPVPVPQPVN